ncbi:MAG: KEOPS complex subunit Cgi121 [Methanomassiliicoccales archaeon]|jgi:KEOPS complex subunit Cgi121|nr:KEOPS complex subunit Cgi121 [Methanomassiliicoccales archaeon]
MSDFEVMGAKAEGISPSQLLSRLRSVRSGQVLALSAACVCGREHLEVAAEHALRAFQRGTNSANNVMMETLLFASGERQIARAQEKMSLKEGDDAVALVLFGASPAEVLQVSGLEQDDSVLECDELKLRRFGITAMEAGSVPEGLARDLVLERVAFVEILKR